MQVDCMIPKKPIDWTASEAYKKELTLGKISEVCQLGFDQTQEILNLLIKQIVSCLNFHC
jgi:hypothetical protein